MIGKHAGRYTKILKYIGRSSTYCPRICGFGDHRSTVEPMTYGAPDGTRTHMGIDPRDFKSLAYTGFATGAAFYFRMVTRRGFEPLAQ